MVNANIYIFISSELTKAWTYALEFYPQLNTLYVCSPFSTGKEESPTETGI